MEWSELIAWIGWALTAGAWGWRSWQWRRRFRAKASCVTERHRLDTWTAALHDGSGAIVAFRHGRGTMPMSIRRGAHTYAFERADTVEPSLHHFIGS